MLKKIIVITIVVSIVILIIAWSVDYFRVKNNQDPMFCLRKNHIEVEERGTIDQCIGLGYKVYNYNLDTLQITEFVIIFTERKE